MTSPSVGRDASGEPPPPDRLAVLYKLVDKTAMGGTLSRYARGVDLTAAAATHAEALFPRRQPRGRAPAHGRQYMSRQHRASCTWRRVRGVSTPVVGASLSAIPILQRRLESNTLLPGTIREEELDYAVHDKAAAFKAQNKPIPSPAVLQTLASTMGYNTLLDAMFKGLDLLPFAWWPAAQKRIVESVVLQGLDAIPRTAGVAHTSAGEVHVVASIEKHMNPHNYDPAFCASVLRKWRSEAVSSVLRARGVLQTGIAKSEQSNAEFGVRERADIAKHGLRDCALPSCSKTEKTVKEFAHCSGCRTVVYCCLEHPALDWRAHKKACREKKEAARLADELAAMRTGGEAAAGCC